MTPLYPAGEYAPLPRFSKKTQTNIAPSASRKTARARCSREAPIIGVALSSKGSLLSPWSREPSPRQCSPRHVYLAEAGRSTPSITPRGAEFGNLANGSALRAKHGRMYPRAPPLMGGEGVRDRQAGHVLVRVDERARVDEHQNLRVISIPSLQDRRPEAGPGGSCVGPRGKRADRTSVVVRCSGEAIGAAPVCLRIAVIEELIGEDASGSGPGLDPHEVSPDVVEDGVRCRVAWLEAVMVPR